MFTLSIEKVIGRCESAGLVSQGRIALSHYYPSSDIKRMFALVDSCFRVVWEKNTGERQYAVIPTEEHERILVTTSNPVNKDDQIPKFTCVLDFDEGGNQLGLRDSPFMGASLSRLPLDRGYTAFGTCFVRGARSHWETRAAVLPANSSEVNWLPGISAAWLPCGKTALSDGETVAIGGLEADGSFSATQIWQCPVSGFHQLFEIDSTLWIASSTALAYLGAIDDGKAPLQRRYDWPEPRMNRYVCYPPYVVAAGSFRAPFVLNTRSGEVKNLSLDEDPKVKDVFSLDIEFESGRVIILTLHRTIHSPDALLRIWEQDI